MPRRPDQQPGQQVPYAPGSRSGAPVQVTNLAGSGLALDATVASVNATLAAPAQDQTVASLLSQVVNNGAQPWVPGMHSASATLKSPGNSLVTVHTFTKPSRIWGVVVTCGAGVTAGTGTQSVYALIKTGGGVVLAVVELAVAGTTANDSGSSALPIPGIPVSSGDTLLFDINGGVSITGGAIRASCSILYSVP